MSDTPRTDAFADRYESEIGRPAAIGVEMNRERAEDVNKWLQTYVDGDTTGEKWSTYDTMRFVRLAKSLQRHRDVALKLLRQSEAALAEAQKTVEIRAEQIRCMTEWLDANQPDVWSRGIWDAMKAAIDAAK